ncbi:MAG: hypothetical protein HY689_13975 [Chloroflexi bacterium]|nr:hypothetical protein [Chloroflexota bacterium]
MTRWWAALLLALVVVGLAAGRTVRPGSATAAAPSCAVSAGAYQPFPAEVALALEHAAVGQSGSGYPDLPPLRVGLTDPRVTAAAAPCVLVKAMAYLESSWRQARGVPAGAVGPALVSPSCGYGVMQITWGMRSLEGLPFPTQYRIATDYRYNIGWGVRMLVDRWNATPGVLPPVGDRNPAVIENWYYAVWAYNQWTSANNPNNPDLPWPRPAYDGTQSKTDYPYQELVWGLAANPPRRNGAPLWEPVPLTLPRREDVGLTPGPLALPDPVHPSVCAPPPREHTIALPWLTRDRR